MPLDPESFADMLVLRVKASMAPVLADVKSLQTQIAGWESRWNDLGALRERVAVVESKAVPEPRQEPVAPVVDLSPVLERVAATEARVAFLPDAQKAIDELRDRVTVVETKAEIVAAAPPNPPDAAFYELRDRVLAVENKSAPPFEMPADVLMRLAALEARPLVMPQSEKSFDFAPVEQRLSRLELGLEMKVAETAPILTALADHTKDLGSLRERLAVVEVRPPQPGPPGEPGPPGMNGKDGLAGLSYEGVYQDGQSYEKGQLTTWAGSCWHCNNPTTTKPGEGSKDWTLMVKRGRDGRDGRDAIGAAPVVTVGGRA